MTRILDKSFRYVPSDKTDIRKTFARVRAELKRAAEERAVKVQPIKRSANDRP